MSTAVPVKQITANELARLPESKNFELVNGQLFERIVSGLSSEVALELGCQIKNFIQDKNAGALLGNHLGSVFGADCGFQCFDFDGQRVRRPRVSFITSGRLTGSERASDFIKIAPDLAVEVVSPNDFFHEFESRIRDYLKAGVRLVWVINPVARFGRVHRLNGSPTDLDENGVFDGEDVIPGFKCTLGDTIPKPNKAEPKADEPKNND